MGKKRTGLEVGDVVRTILQVLPKAHWPLARLTEMYLGQDQHVRVVKVQIGKTSFLQPISKLFNEQNLPNCSRNDQLELFFMLRNEVLTNSHLLTFGKHLKKHFTFERH